MHQAVRDLRAAGLRLHLAHEKLQAVAIDRGVARKLYLNLLHRLEIQAKIVDPQSPAQGLPSSESIDGAGPAAAGQPPKA